MTSAKVTGGILVARRRANYILDAKLLGKSCEFNDVRLELFVGKSVRSRNGALLQ
jgi:hypothetical protein